MRCIGASMDAERAGLSTLIAMPAPTGTAISRNSAMPSSGTIGGGAASLSSSEAASVTKTGSVTTETRLISPVSEIDSARSPPAKRVMMLEVAPPGQNDRIITPRPTGGGRSNSMTIDRAATGTRTSCEAAPMPKAFGRCRTRRKSSVVSPSPSENMMTTSASGRKTVRKIFNVGAPSFFAQHMSSGPDEELKT